MVAALLVGATIRAAVALALPDPTAPGPHAVATTMVAVPFTSASGEVRTLDATVWYPAAADGAVARGRHPLLIFSHGLCGLPTNSTFFAEALASFGVIVAAPPHAASQLGPGCLTGIAASFTDRPGEVTAVVDAMLAADRDPTSHFARRLRRGRLGIAGHSYGGQTAIRVAAADPRMRVAVAFAPALYGPGVADVTTSVPTLVMVGALDTFAPPESQARPYYALLHGPRLLVQIADTGHFAFSDRCTFGVSRPDCAPDTLTQADAHAQALRGAVPFLLRYLMGQRAWSRLLPPRTIPSGLEVVARARLSRRVSSSRAAGGPPRRSRRAVSRCRPNRCRRR